MINKLMFERLRKWGPIAAGSKWVDHWIPLSMALVGGLCLGGLSVFRHSRFASNGYDLGIFDQTIWGYSRLEMVSNTVRGVPNLLGDHFHPVLMLLTPTYWIWNDVRMLLLVQGLLLAGASIPLYMWASERLGGLPALLIQMSFIGFWGILAGDLYDFHEVAVAVPVLSVAIYAMLTKRDRLLLLAVGLGLLTKENVALTFIMLGLYIALVQRRWRLGGAIGVLSAAWFLLIMKVVIPGISGKAYSYWSYTTLGPDPVSALKYLAFHPFESLKLLFNETQKVSTWKYLLTPWLLLPLLSPIALIALPTLAERFWSTNALYWGLGFHYSLIAAPVLAFAAIDGLARVKSYLPSRVQHVGTVVTTMVMALFGAYVTFFKAQPQNELRGYVSAARAMEIDSCIGEIPKSASVAATSAVIPHLTHRREVYPVSDRLEGEYLAIDFSTSIWPLSHQKLTDIVSRALKEDYGVQCSKGHTVVLRRGAEPKDVSSELDALLSH